MRRKKAGVSSEEVQNGDIQERIAKVFFCLNCESFCRLWYSNFLFMSLETKVCVVVKISCTCRMKAASERCSICICTLGCGVAQIRCGVAAWGGGACRTELVLAMVVDNGSNSQCYKVP